MILNKRSLLYIGIAIVLMLIFQVRPGHSYAATVSLSKTFPTVSRTVTTSYDVYKSTSSTTNGTGTREHSLVSVYQLYHPAGDNTNGQPGFLRTYQLLTPSLQISRPAIVRPSLTVEKNGTTTVVTVYVQK